MEGEGLNDILGLVTFEGGGKGDTWVLCLSDTYFSHINKPITK